MTTAKHSASSLFVPTNIKEFDKLLRQGFVLPHDPDCGLVVLVKGEPGTGKSTFALQILSMLGDAAAANGAKPRRYYFSVEQTEIDLRFKLAGMLVWEALNQSWQYHDDGKLVCTTRALLNRLKTKWGLVAEFPSIKQLSVEFPPSSGKQEEALRRELNGITQIVCKSLPKPPKTPLVQFNWPPRDREDAIIPHWDRASLALEMLNELMKGEGQKPRERLERPFVVVDGLSVLPPVEQDVISLSAIVERLRRESQIGILVFEPSGQDMGWLDHQVDMVIELSERWIEKPISYLIHEMWIRKARYQDAALGRHQFKIRGSGLEIFPSIHFQVQMHHYMHREWHRSLRPVDLDSGNAAGTDMPTKAPGVDATLKNASLLEQILGRVDTNDSVMLLGPRGSFKTQLSLDFLFRGTWGCPCDRNGNGVEDGLLIALIDNAEQIHDKLQCPMSGCKECQNRHPKHIFAFHQRPGCITPAEFFLFIRNRIEDHQKKAGRNEKINRVVFWDLTQMDYRFPLFAEDPMFLPAMIDYFKNEKIKSLFMGAGNARYTHAASAMADNVVFCWPSGQHPAKTRGKAKPEQSLMIYVDRVSGYHRQELKGLYRISLPTHLGQRFPLNQRPERVGQLDAVAPEDKDEIQRIRMLQGVA